MRFFREEHTGGDRGIRLTPGKLSKATDLSREHVLRGTIDFWVPLKGRRRRVVTGFVHNTPGTRSLLSKLRLAVPRLSCKTWPITCGSTELRAALSSVCTGVSDLCFNADLQVSKLDTLAGLAVKYHVTVRIIMSLYYTRLGDREMNALTVSPCRPDRLQT